MILGQAGDIGKQPFRAPPNRAPPVFLDDRFEIVSVAGNPPRILQPPELLFIAGFTGGAKRYPVEERTLLGIETNGLRRDVIELHFDEVGQVGCHDPVGFWVVAPPVVGIDSQESFLLKVVQDPVIIMMPKERLEPALR